MRILFVGGGLETVPGIHLAKKMGLEVWVSDRNPNAAGMLEADTAIIADTYNPDETFRALEAEIQKQGPLHGVICQAVDVPFTVARIAERLGLPGISARTAKICSNKWDMKRVFQEKNIPIPDFAPLRAPEEITDWVEKYGRVVLKPPDSRGSRGVLLLDQNVDPQWAFNISQSYTKLDYLLIERYISGPQLSTESLVIQGEAYSVGFSDRNYRRLAQTKPFIVEDGGECPSQLPQDFLNKASAVIQQVARALGIQNGVIKGDLVFDGDHVCVIEIAPRLSGGYFCSHEIPYQTGVDFVGSAIKLALGQKVDPKDLKPIQNKPLAQRYFFPDPGRVTQIQMPDPKTFPEVFFWELRVREGDLIEPIHHHPARAGVLIASGETVEKAIKNADKAVKAVKINTL